MKFRRSLSKVVELMFRRDLTQHGRNAIVAACLILLGLPAVARAQSESVEYYGLDALGPCGSCLMRTGILSRMDYGPFGQELIPSTGKQQGIYAGCLQKARPVSIMRMPDPISRVSGVSAQWTPLMTVSSHHSAGTDTCTRQILPLIESIRQEWQTLCIPLTFTGVKMHRIFRHG